MRFLYFGDGLWATNCLRRLIDDGHRPLAVVLRRSPSDESLGLLAEELGLPVESPEWVNADAFVEWTRSMEPELNISMSYDQILRRPIIDSAPLGFINCHAGMLPRYRGRNVINWAIINNESEIGLTVHYVDEGIDTGDIIVQRALPIEWTDDYGTVLASVQAAFPAVLSEAVHMIERGDVLRISQDRYAGTYFPRRVPGDEVIDWSDTSLNIYNMIRAITDPGPGARTTIDGRELIVWRARYAQSWPTYIAIPGRVVGYWPGEGAVVKTGDSVLCLDLTQLDGEERRTAPRLTIGAQLGGEKL